MVAATSSKYLAEADKTKRGKEVAPMKHLDNNSFHTPCEVFTSSGQHQKINLLSTGREEEPSVLFFKSSILSFFIFYQSRTEPFRRESTGCLASFYFDGGGAL
jgi:hypothetical protein